MRKTGAAGAAVPGLLASEAAAAGSAKAAARFGGHVGAQIAPVKPNAGG